jgi:hypothetical protein
MTEIWDSSTGKDSSLNRTMSLTFFNLQVCGPRCLSQQNKQTGEWGQQRLRFLLGGKEQAIQQRICQHKLGSLYRSICPVERRRC